MEIVTYVIDGQLEHRDTMGNRGVITAGEVQRMTAGTGVRHSEFNPSDDKPTHLLQLWLLPAEPQLTPSWEQKSYPAAERAGKLLPIAIPAGNANRPEHAVEVHQDATIYTSLLGPGQAVRHSFGPGRRGYIFVVDGELQINGQDAEDRRSGAHLRRIQGRTRGIRRRAAFRTKERRERGSRRFLTPRLALIES